MSFLCLICSEDCLHVVEGFSALPRVTSDARPFPAGGTLNACSNCGAVQKLPDRSFLDEIDEIYSTYSLYELAGGTEQVVFVNGSPRRRSEVLVDLLDADVKPNTVIDVGCGNGAALRTFSQKLPTAKLWGSELSDRTEARLRELPNFQSLFTGSVSDIKLRFDALTMIHVLEHVLAPVQFLSDCAALLETNGSMLVEVPDVDTSPFDLIIADHLTHFSVKTLGHALSRAGLRSSLLTNKILPKEVTAVARRAQVSGNGLICADDGLRLAKNTVRWIASVLAHAREVPTDRPIGIFGTAMAGMWLYGDIKNRVSFFVDEDEAKVGNAVDGLPIVRPADVPRNARVLVPLAPAAANIIAHRWSSADREYVALGSGAAKSFLEA
jgi:2-polyprenyl-3-methyl-5-hydroxy-6-metoxy-1,4-benzoquinol methylase